MMGSSDDSQGIAVALALMGLCGLAYAVTHASAVRRTFATSRHLVDVEHVLLQLVARAQRTRIALFAMACAGIAFGIAVLPVELGVRSMLMVTPMILLIVAMFGFFRLQTLVDLEQCPGVRVTSHGHYLFVSHGKRLIGWVSSPPSLIARVSALPIAKMRG